jgi:hypothetical protein
MSLKDTCIETTFYIAIVFGVIMLIRYFTTEKFDDFHGNFCKSCDNRTAGQCLNCANCGVAVNNNRGNCVPGDMTGPYDRSQPQRWVYSDSFWRNIGHVSSLEENGNPRISKKFEGQQHSEIYKAYI